MKRAADRGRQLNVGYNGKMSDDEFMSQECLVIIPRLEGIEPVTRSRLSDNRSRRVSVGGLEDSESDFEPLPRVSSGPSRMSSRYSRKRTSGDVEDAAPHVNKAKGGPASVKKSKTAPEYDPEKDNLSFVPPNPKKYTVISTIIPPTYSDAISDCCLFPLNKSQSKKINVDNYCVLLRLTYFNKQDGGYEDIFDYGMDIRINDVPLPLTSPTEDNVNAPLDGPADISRYLVAEGATMEKIKIAFEGHPKPHIFSVLFCKKKVDELPYVTLRYQEPNQTFKLAHRVCERFMANPDKIFRKVYTLVDPISKQRIDIPVRGQNCAHVECFDKNTFLRANRRKLDWSCPICAKLVKEDDLIADGLFIKILAKTYASCTSVELNSQGGWCPIYREKVFRVRTVDLENGTSEGEEDEEEEESAAKTPEGPLSPVEVPPEPEEPEIPIDSCGMVPNGVNGDDPMLGAREAETQTPSNPHWNSESFEVTKGDVAMDGPTQSTGPDYSDVYDNDTNEATAPSNPTTCIQQVLEKEEDMPTAIEVHEDS